MGDYVCYSINVPYAETKFYAFVGRSEPLAEELQRSVTWGTAPLESIVTLQRETFPHGVSHLKITDLVSEGWHRPVD